MCSYNAVATQPHEYGLWITKKGKSNEEKEGTPWKGAVYIKESFSAPWRLSIAE